MAGKEKGVDKREWDAESHGNHDGYSDEYEDMKSEVEEDRLQNYMKVISLLFNLSTNVIHHSGQSSLVSLQYLDHHIWNHLSYLSLEFCSSI